MRTIGLVLFGMLFLALAIKERRLRNDFELLHEDVIRIDAEFVALRQSLRGHDGGTVTPEPNAKLRRNQVEPREFNERQRPDTRPLLRTAP